jgi:hypothetical protein
MTVLWDPVQRAILAELGHPPLALAPLADDPLLHAVLRAAGRDPDAPDVAAIVRLLPPTSVLRQGGAPAKRALWPLLRRLRK